MCYLGRLLTAEMWHDYPLRLVFLCLLLPAYLRTAESSKIQCYCDLAWGLPSPECVLHDYHCSSASGCYLRRWLSDEHKLINQDWGCIRDEHGVHSQIDYSEVYCGAWDTADDAYKCCNSSDDCNKNLTITLPIETLTPSQTLLVVSPSASLVMALPDGRGGNGGHLVIAVTVSISLFLLVLLSLLLLVFLLLALQRKRRLLEGLSNSAKNPTSVHWTCQRPGGIVGLPGSGVDGGGETSPPYQVLGNIEDIVKLNYQIEIGRFGVFYHGFYEGTKVALKRFGEGHHAAWLRESLMYTGVLQPHENLLTFFASAMTVGAADDCGSGSELWLVTRYHEFGSLQDYLRQHTVSARVLLQMAASVASGLAHLHSESCGHQVKIPVAHCNLTSRNILVKENLSCVVGDFRLAVFKHKNETCRPEQQEARSGAVRYMAPEVLSQPLGGLSFETFKQADVYALGLVLWEVCQRGHYSGVSAEAYQVPFQGLVPPEPSLDDMQRLVVTKRVQPTISNRWNHSKLLREMTKVMRECWYYTSTARPTAVYLKKKLLKTSQEFENMDFATEDQVAVARKQESSDRHCGGKVYVSAL